MSCILLTGYEAFADTPINPAEQVVNALAGEQIEGLSGQGLVVANRFFDRIQVVVEATRK